MSKEWRSGWERPNRLMAFVLICISAVFPQATRGAETKGGDERQVVEELRRQPPAVQRAQIPELAQKGNVWAARRMIELRLFDDMGKLDLKPLEAWKGKDDRVGDMTAGQIYADLLANWACRQRAWPKEKQEKIQLEARRQMLRDPATHPILRSELAWLLHGIEPKDPERADALVKEVIEAVHRTPEDMEPLTRASLFLELGDTVTYASECDSEVGAKSCEEAARLYEKAGDKKGQGLSLCEQAMFLRPDEHPDGDWKEAAAVYATAARILQEAGDARWQARSLFRQAICLREDEDLGDGRWESAAVLYAEAAGLSRGTKDWPGLQESLFWQAQCRMPSCNPKGSWNEVIALYRESAGLCRETKNVSDEINRYRWLGWCFQPDNNPNGTWEKAIANYRETIRLSAEIGDRAEQIEGLQCLAVCTRPDLNPNGSWDEAIKLHVQAAQLSEDAEDMANYALHLEKQAECLEPLRNLKGSWVRACRLYLDAARIRGQLGDVAGQAYALVSAAYGFDPGVNPNGDWSRAAVFYARAAAQYALAEDSIQEAYSRLQAGLCLIRRDRKQMTAQARALIKAAVQLYRAAGEDEQARKAADWIGGLDTPPAAEF